MNWTVVILKGPKQYLTLGTVKFGKYGQTTDRHIILCDTWEQGFADAQQQGFSHALFVKHGTVFTDWDAWRTLVDSYPHQGLIGHIIFRPGSCAHLDDQCWFMDLTQFDTDDFLPAVITQPVPARSEKNIHDDYTPLWIRPSAETEKFESVNFGQGLIARQLNNNKSVVNWNNSARDLKRFEYQTGDYKDWLKDYITLAETQLWVFNNEPLTITPIAHLITPGSGLHWMLYRCCPDVKIIDIVDISRIQLDFCKQLLNNWSGCNYGQFVWDYIQKNNLTHYELNCANLTPLERLKFKKQQYFVDYVNSEFERVLEQVGIKDFAAAWANSKCQTNITCANLATYDIPKDARVWLSNILDYKYTLITTDYNRLLYYEKTNQ